MTPFANWTTRSAGDLLADIKSCRQLRHVSMANKERIAAECFSKIDGEPRGFVWTYEAFMRAFGTYGYACDTCETVTKLERDRWRKAADRALDNMDGQVKLMLCAICAQSAHTFARKTFSREMRVPYTDDLEKMMIAFVALQTRKEANKVMRQPVDELSDA